MIAVLVLAEVKVQIAARQEAERSHAECERLTTTELRARLPAATLVAEYGDGLSVRLPPVAGRSLSDAVEQVQQAAGEGWVAHPSYDGRSPIIRLFRRQETS